MFCIHCGMKIESSKFCPYCGAPVEPAPAVNTPSGPAPAAPIETSPAEPSPAEAAPVEPSESLTAPETSVPEWTPQPEPQPQAPQWPPQWTPQQTEPQPQTPQGPGPQVLPTRPVEWQQAVRYDSMNTYQYHQAYDPQNQPGGPNPAEPVKKQKKGGKKTALFIILGIAAAFLVAGAVILLLSLKNCSGGKASGSYLRITTQDGGRYLNDEKGVLCEEADMFYASTSDLKAHLIKRNDRWYYVENGKETRFGDSDSSIITYDQQNLSWVLYEDKNGEINIFRKGNSQDILIGKAGGAYRAISSASGKYFVLNPIREKGSTLYRFSASSGELLTIYDGREDASFYGVDDNGIVYYNVDGRSYITDGKDEVELEEINSVRILEDVLFCAHYNSLTGADPEFYTRPLGMKGELKPLSEEMTEKLKEATSWYYLNSNRFSTGYGISQGAYKQTTNYLLVGYDEDLYLMDLKAGTEEFFMDNIRLGDYDTFWLTEDKQTAYVQSGSMLYKLTRGKNGWEKERVSRRFKSLGGYRGNGLFFEEEDGAVVAYDGKKAVTFEEIGGSLYDVSDDLKSLAYLEDNKVMYIQEEGKKAERLARDNGGSRIAVFQGYVYYINEDGSLARVKPGKDPEIVMEDVRTFSHIVY